MRFRILLLAAVLLAFGGALWAPFQFEDHSFFSDPALGSDSGWRQAFAALQTRPLTYLTFWLNLQASEAPWSFHLVSLLLHLASVWLTHAALRGLLPARSADLAAVLFAIHPLQTEAVVYVSARATVLAGFLCILALWLWLGERRWAAVIAFAAALLAKEEAAAFPLLLALLEWSTRRRQQALVPLLTMSALVLAAGIRAMLTTSAIAASGAGTLAGIASFDYFSFQGVAILRYLWLMLAPMGLTVDADVRVQPLLASVAWGVIAVVAMLAWRTVRGAGAGFWILGGLLLLVPSSSVFPTFDLAADRRMYLPMLCFAALFGLLLENADWRLLTGYCAVLAGLSVAQTQVWQNPHALWMEASRLAPGKIRPKLQLSRIVPALQAVELLEDARRLAADDPDIATDLGLAYLRAGKPELALAEFGRAVALAPASAVAMHNRGLALLMLNQREAARGDFERALMRDPCLFDAHWNLKRMGIVRGKPGNCSWTRQQDRSFSGELKLQPSAR